MTQGDAKAQVNNILLKSLEPHKLRFEEACVFMRIRHSEELSAITPFVFGGKILPLEEIATPEQLMCIAIMRIRHEQERQDLFRRYHLPVVEKGT